MSLKRPRSPSPSFPSVPPAQRVGVAGPSGHSVERSSSTNTSGQNHQHAISDIFGYQELFLRILSFLSPTELALVQGVDRYWSRMTVDPQLWKRLYLSRYPHPHHSRLVYKDPPRSALTSGPSTPSRLRPIARLPSRAFPPPSPSRSPSASSIAGLSTPVSEKTERVAKSGKGVAVPLSDREDIPELGYGVRNDGVDWKMMMRLGTNWANGNALSQKTISLPPSPSPSGRSLDDPIEGPRANRPPPYSEQHIALFPAFIFTSNPSSPLVHVHRSSSAETTAPLGIIPPPPGWSSPHRPDNITAICADQSVSQVDNPGSSAGMDSPARLAVFYQSGGFVVLNVRLDGQRLQWSRESIHPAQSRPRSIRRRATAYLPLEVAFHMSVYLLSDSPGENDRPKHISTMHSDVSFHPAALSLFPASQDSDQSSTETSFRGALTYCSPLYPASWTISVQEFGIDLDRFHSGDVRRGECYSVGRGDEADEEDEIWPRKVRPIVGVKGKSAVGVGTDGRWCVLAGEDNQIQVYSLPTPSSSPVPSRPSPILHSQTLLAHSAAVTSISLNAGRCVSGGRDGRVLVWELDEDELESQGKIGRTVGYVEVKQGGRRWKGPSGPIARDDEEGDDLEEDEDLKVEIWSGLPHPASISTAARTLFLPRPPDARDERPPAIRQLAFDEEKIVGLVHEGSDEGRNGALGEVMKVWSFSG